MSLRYLAPPAMVLGVGLGAVVGLAWRPALLVPLAYAAGIAVGGTVISRGEGAATRLRVPAALATMHWSWGLGFLSSPRDLVR
jgi:hypothetical protein